MATQGQSRLQKKAFLDHFAEFGNVTSAAKYAGIARTCVYKWQEHDDDFVAAFREAEIQSTETLEAEARRRAVEGVTNVTPVYSRTGEFLYEITETKYSDTLLIFLLKARAPEKYRDRYDVTTGGQPIQASHEDLDAAIERRLAEMAARSEGAFQVAATGSSEAADA